MIDNGEKLPGFTALVDFVEQKVCEMTATVAANPETRKIVDQTLTDVTNTLASFFSRISLIGVKCHSQLGSKRVQGSSPGGVRGGAPRSEKLRQYTLKNTKHATLSSS